MKNTRTNSEWVMGLGFRDDETIEALRSSLMGAAIVYLRKRLPEWNASDIRCLAEDLAQDATMQVLGNLSGFRGDSKFTTWAYSFVINLAAHDLTLKRHGNIRIDDKKDPMRYLASLLREQQTATAENLAERRNILEIISGIIESLPERQRKAVIGVCLKQLPVATVAESIGLKDNNNAFYRLLHEARVNILVGLKKKYLTLGDIYATFER